MENIAYIALGSNMGERSSYLKEAIEKLESSAVVSVLDHSSIYETEPVGYADQASFLNMVIKVTTSLKPLELLDVTQQIELQLGRKRELRWGPRTLDLDILLYNHENIESERLIVPHPRMFERAFVMIPLMELEPCLQGRENEPFNIDELPDKEGVHIWKRKNGEDAFALFEN